MGDVEKFIRFCGTEFGQEIMDLEAEYIKREFKSHHKILDVGCGIGSIEERLPQLDVTGVDRSKEMISEARARSDNAFSVADAQNLPFKENSFDGVFYLTSLEFLGDYEKAIREGHRVLTRNGRFLAMILNPNSDYFHQGEGSYFNKIKHTNLEEISECASRYFLTTNEYFLGIDEGRISPLQDKRHAALYTLNGMKKWMN